MMYLQLIISVHGVFFLEALVWSSHLTHSIYYEIHRIIAIFDKNVSKSSVESPPPPQKISRVKALKSIAGFPSIHTGPLWQKYGLNTDPISIKKKHFQTVYFTEWTKMVRLNNNIMRNLIFSLNLTLLLIIILAKYRFYRPFTDPKVQKGLYYRPRVVNTKPAIGQIGGF